MRKKITFITVGAVCFLGCVAASFWFGLTVGAQNGAWRADTETAAALAHASKLRDRGELDKSSNALHTLLYSSAATTDRYKDNLLLNDANRKAAERTLQAVADYYWSHPESFNLQWESPESSPTGPVGNAMAPALQVYDEQHKRIAAILTSRRKPATRVQ
jgi:hypothetical protein